MDILNLFSDTWKSIPHNIRLVFAAGSFFIFNAWLLDHWGNTHPKFLGLFEIVTISYSLGLIVISLGISLVIVKQVIHFSRIVSYRIRYGLNKLNKDYFLIWFNQTLYLFDDKSKPKKYYHIKPWDTAQDLRFTDKGLRVNFNLNSDKEFGLIVRVADKKLKVADYDDGGDINTQD